MIWLVLSVCVFAFEFSYVGSRSSSCRMSYAGSSTYRFKVSKSKLGTGAIFQHIFRFSKTVKIKIQMTHKTSSSYNYLHSSFSFRLSRISLSGLLSLRLCEMNNRISLIMF